MSIERKAGLLFGVIGVAALVVKLITKPKIEWDWSDSGEALAWMVLVIAGVIAYATAPRK